jgi:hypothetical protein
MRTVRVQVYARQKYRSKDGHFDIRALTLEAEIESSDGETGAIWELQRQCDSALESWISLHVLEDLPPPVQPPTHDDQVVTQDDKIPF